MIFRLSSEYDEAKATEYFNKCKAEKWNIEIKHLCPQRSDRQNRYLHLILGLLGTIVGMSIEQVKQDIFKEIVNRDIFYQGVRYIGDKEVSVWRSTKSLTTDEMSLAITRYRNFCSSELHVYISTPEDNEFLLYCQQQIENNKEYM